MLSQKQLDAVLTHVSMRSQQQFWAREKKITPKILAEETANAYSDLAMRFARFLANEHRAQYTGALNDFAFLAYRNLLSIAKKPHFTDALSKQHFERIVREVCEAYQNGSLSPVPGQPVYDQLFFKNLTLDVRRGRRVNPKLIGYLSIQHLHLNLKPITGPDFREILLYWILNTTSIVREVAEAVDYVRSKKVNLKEWKKQ